MNLIFSNKQGKLDKVITTNLIVTLQVLHYEFLGPVKLSQWGPPMEKVVYLLLYQENDKFHIFYVDQCEKTNDPGFFTKNPLFKNWIKFAGSEENIYLCILPLFESTTEERQKIATKIISHYKPICNTS